MTFSKIKHVKSKNRTDLNDKHVTSVVADWNNRVLSDNVVIKEGIDKEIERMSQSVRDVRSRSTSFLFLMMFILHNILRYLVHGNHVFLYPILVLINIEK